jgi:Tfp pilus assembly protein PilF
MASVMIWAQTPRADLQGEQLGAAAEHLQQGKTEQAIRECKGVLATDPRSAPAHMLLALAYIAKGSIDMVADAKAELQQTLDIDPELVWARFYLARLYLDQGLSEKAQEQLEIGLKQSPAQTRRSWRLSGVEPQGSRGRRHNDPGALFPGACISGPETGTAGDS